MTYLPQIALVLCFVVFLAVIWRAVFGISKSEVKRISELPLEKDK